VSTESPNPDVIEQTGLNPCQKIVDTLDNGCIIPSVEDGGWSSKRSAMSRDSHPKPEPI
jgi:hypothetical protein